VMLTKGRAACKRAGRQRQRGGEWQGSTGMGMCIMSCTQPLPQAGGWGESEIDALCACWGPCNAGGTSQQVGLSCLRCYSQQLAATGGGSNSSCTGCSSD
jgi:hypothetical protein